jgi:hypothetical protein
MANLLSLCNLLIMQVPLRGAAMGHSFILVRTLTKAK